MDTFDYVNDPLTAGQIATLASLLQEEWTEKARDGFLVISGRFIDETGMDRTEELGPLFHTDTPQGRLSLRLSLETLFDAVGSLQKFETDYPVYINDPVHGSLGVFPQLPIVGIRTLQPSIYRLFDSNAAVYKSTELVRDYIMRAGNLPLVEPPASLILRKKAYMYWCSPERYESPDVARAALQILDEWHSDLKMRATLPTAELEGLAFVAYSGVSEYSPYVKNLSKNPPAFAGYNVELKVSDHPKLPGGGLQIGVVGEPPVTLLERWDDTTKVWIEVWSR
ncbi:MAG TPA: hypothetical protein VGP73_18510 [Thermoanaerobaculia bacterium]